MKSLTKCVDESCQQITSYMIDEAKAKGEVYKYEEAKNNDPSKFKDRIQLIGHEGKWMRENFGPIYIEMVTNLARKSKEQFLADCDATIKSYNPKAKWCEILAWDQDENDFVQFAATGRGTEMWHPDFIENNREFHRLFR